LELIYHEIHLRRQRQEQPAVEELVQRFPQYADTLRRHFEAVPPAGPGGTPTVPPSQGATLAAAGNPEVAFPAVAGYQILGVLGQGGMGVVYQAEQTGLKRLVALKMILAGPHARPEERARFRIEAEAVARLQHPNIAQIYEVNESEGRPYLSLEFV